MRRDFATFTPKDQSSSGTESRGGRIDGGSFLLGGGFRSFIFA